MNRCILSQALPIRAMHKSSRSFFSRSPGGGAVLAARHYQHRTRGASHNLFRNAAQHHVAQPGAAMSRHHDHVDALALSSLQDIPGRRSDLHTLSTFDEVDAIREMISKKLVQLIAAILEHVMVGPRDRRPVMPLASYIDSVIDNHLGAGIARDFQSITHSALRQI